MDLTKMGKCNNMKGLLITYEGALVQMHACSHYDHYEVSGVLKRLQGKHHLPKALPLH